MLSSVTTWPDFPKGLKVLLLDGCVADKECTEALLKEADYDVTTCSTSAEAISQLKQPHTFHLVLADYRIFSFETGDNLKLLRLLKKSRKTLAFLLLSDSTCAADVLQGVKLGAAEVIPKPLSPLKARTLWQHTVRKMMVKSPPQEMCRQDLSVDDSDSNSLEHPRTPSADIGCDTHQSCETCSSDSTSDLPDMLAFDLDCEEFSLDQFVGIPESSMSLTDKPPTPDSFSNAAPAQPSPVTPSPSPSPPSAGSNSLTASMSAPVQDCCTTPPPPAGATCPATQQMVPEQQPQQHLQQQQQLATFNAQHPHIGMHAMAPPVGGMPMWGMPPMPLMPGMMPGCCPPFMMPPFMRPFGPMPMPPMGMGGMGMPMMPFPMCPMPLGMPPMMYPPPFQFPYNPQLQMPVSAPAAAEPPCAAPAAPAATSAHPCWAPCPSQAAGAPPTGHAQANGASAAVQQQKEEEQPHQQQQQQPKEEQQHQDQDQEQPLEPLAEGTDAAWASFWTDGPDSGEPPLGLQLKKSNSLLDLLSQHLFSTCSASAAST